MLRLRDGERVDVVAAAGEQPDDTRQHAGLIVDQYRERVALDRLLDRRGGVMARARRRPVAHTSTLPFSSIAFSMSPGTSPSSISLWALPDGIIGKQFSVWSTMQSKMTGLSTSIISLMAWSRSPGFSQRMPTPR